MFLRFTRWGVGGIAALVLVHVTVSAAVIYVDSDAPGGGDGTSWAGAYADLGRALDVAIAGDEVRVAGGVYRPGPAGGDRASWFFIDSPIRLIGGFAGTGQPDPDARDLAAYPTILSGDLNGDDLVEMWLEDLPGEPTRQDNAYHVVRFGDHAGGSILDGFIITGGNANGDEWYYGSGGGISGGDYYLTHPLIRFCTIEFNTAAQSSGGAYVQGRFEDCFVRFNYSDGYGGGLGSVTEVTRCVIEENGCGEYGGGLNVWSARITDSVIRDNTAKLGGGLYAGPAGIEMTGCTVENNIASEDGGGIFVGNCGTCNGFPVLYRCRIIGNKAGRDGGGFYEYPSEGWLWSCLFVGNTAGNSGGGIYEGTDGYCGIVNCTVFANAANDGGGMFYQNAYGSIEGLVTNSIFWGNTDAAGAGTEQAQIQLVGQYNTGHTPDDSPLSALVNHSCIQGLTFAYTGSGNISADPWFVNFYGEDDIVGTADDDLHLDGESPCINTGDNGIYSCVFGGPGTGTGFTPPPGTGTTDGDFPGEEGYFMCPRALIDLDAWARIRSGRVDMGAYESAVKPGWVIYVDDSAGGSHDGSCWGDAFTKLQDALAAANAGHEIRVAQGSYRPADPNGSREVTFALKSGVKLLGGYAGNTLPNPDERDIERYKTILSGDLLGNDGSGLADIDWLTHPIRSDNCYHVVTANHVNSATLFEGFTVTSGNTKEDGPNSSDYRGGGLIGDGSHATIRRCRFENNSAIWGGGLSVTGGAPTVEDCVFVNNAAVNHGGAMESEGGKVLGPVRGCRFVGNVAGMMGGAVWNFDDNPEYLNCVFEGNRATDGGGAVWQVDGGGYRFVNCTFVGNRAGGSGGAINSSERPYLANCIFWDNQDQSGSGELAHVNDWSLSPVFHYCCVQGWTGALPGLGNIGDDPQFARNGYWGAMGGWSFFHIYWVPGDYHLMSQGGRWDPAAKAWVQDSVTSPCIDAGDLGAPIMYEPFPNGGVVNMGAYGGTAEASKSWFGKPVCEVNVAGDINGDCKVDLGDFTIMARHWLEVN